MKEAIPLYFTHNDIRYFGIFTPVMGAGETSVYYLLINDFYQGRLRKNERWIFDGKFSDMGEDFGKFLTFLQP